MRPMTPTSLDFAALTANWQYFHPILDGQLLLIRDDVEPIGFEEFTNLPILTKKRVPGSKIMVKGVNKTMAPQFVIVNDEGEFRACYDASEIDIGDMEISNRKIFFESLGWTVPVYEEFGTFPAAVLLKKDEVELPLIGDFDHPELESAMKFGERVYSFPCPVYDCRNGEVRIKKTSQRVLPYPESDWHTVDHFPRTFTTFKPQKATCGYESTQDYLEHILGIKLHYSDRSWYVDDPRVIDSGLPAERTLDVLTELISPYGLEIDEVWTSPEVWYDEFNPWAAKLGKDDALYQMMKASGADLPAPRWHIGPPPEFIPCVLMTSGKDGGGHASYLGPRSGRPVTYQMALTFRRNNCGRVS